jgi:hypothetical protein
VTAPTIDVDYSSMVGRVLAAAGLSVAVCLAIFVSAQTSETRLGAPAYWAWFLTGMQVTGLWGAGFKRWWGWGVGAAVQPPWIAYALLTAQIGFIPGCAVSAAVQAATFIRGCRADALERHSPRVERGEQPGLPLSRTPRDLALESRVVSDPTLFVIKTVAGTEGRCVNQEDRQWKSEKSNESSR